MTEMPWQPIENAEHLKVWDEHGLTPHVILGFASDEEGYAPSSREGFWAYLMNRWVSALDPNWECSPQPTHWMPLPEPPK